jgi:hypothetical protein
MYSGYESMSTMAGELENPQVIPKATLITVPLIMAVYILRMGFGRRPVLRRCHSKPHSRSRDPFRVRRSDRTVFPLQYLYRIRLQRVFRAR